MKTATHQRIKRLSSSKSNQYASINILQDLHDCIYQWAESIPFGGGAKVDISDLLKRIYDGYAKQQREMPKARDRSLEIDWDQYLLDDTEIHDDGLGDTETPKDFGDEHDSVGDNNEFDDDEFDDDDDEFDD